MHFHFVELFAVYYCGWRKLLLRHTVCVERKVKCVHVFNGMLSLSRTFVYNLTRTTDQKYRRCSAANGTEWHSPTVASTIL